ncbi:MAG: hypothetical protein KDH96_12315 [Candidatus Riesia sp.]|nr:hypothetical protein [Candidatus Riesia sp.]
MKDKLVHDYGYFGLDKIPIQSIIETVMLYCAKHKIDLSKVGFTSFYINTEADGPHDGNPATVIRYKQSNE